MNRVSNKNLVTGLIVSVFVITAASFGMQYLISSNPPRWNVWLSIGSAFIYILGAVMGFLGAGQITRSMPTRKSLFFFGLALLIVVFRDIKGWFITYNVFPPINGAIEAIPFYLLYSAILAAAYIYVLIAGNSKLELKYILEAVGVYGVTVLIDAWYMFTFTLGSSSFRIENIAIFASDGLSVAGVYLLLRLGGKVNPHVKYLFITGLLIQTFVEYIFPNLSQSMSKLVSMTSGVLFSLSIINLYFDAARQTPPANPPPTASLQVQS